MSSPRPLYFPGRAPSSAAIDFNECTERCVFSRRTGAETIHPTGLRLRHGVPSPPRKPRELSKGFVVQIYFPQTPPAVSPVRRLANHTLLYEDGDGPLLVVRKLTSPSFPLRLALVVRAGTRGPPLARRLRRHVNFRSAADAAADQASLPHQHNHSNIASRLGRRRIGTFSPRPFVQLAEHLTFAQTMSALSVKTRRAPSRQ